VNRYLHRITQTKQLWIQIINNLIYRSLLELPSDFIASENSSAELIEHVERAVKGPRTWSPTSRQVSNASQHHRAVSEDHSDWLPRAKESKTGQ
jgi:hypothetical protein